MSQSRLILAALLATILPWVATAAEDIPPGIEERLKVIVPGMVPDSVRETSIAGVYEVSYGPEFIYLSADGRFLLRGEIVDLNTRENLTESRKRQARLKVLEDVGRSSMVSFSPKDPKHEIYVFTDVHCGYCQKLHNEVPELNQMGITVNYLAYPAISANSFPDAVSVWCSDDQQQAMTDAKAGKPIEQKTCDNPVERHFNVGRAFGIRGTPAIVLDNGRIYPGYVPAKDLAKVLNEEG